MDKINKVATYKIIPELSLIINYLGGQVTAYDAIKLKKTEKLDVNFNPNYNYIIDFRDTEIIWNEEMDISLSKLISYMKKENKIVSKRNSAFLISSPQQYILTYFFRKYSRIFPINFQIFSTLEAAVEFTKLSLDHYPFIENEINKLKTNAY